MLRIIGLWVSGPSFLFLACAAQKLLGCGASVACKAVQTLIVDRDRGNMLLDVLTSGFSFGNKHSLHFTARLLESVQMHLIAYSDQVVHAFIEQQQGANGANVFSHPTIVRERAHTMQTGDFSIRRIHLSIGAARALYRFL